MMLEPVGEEDEADLLRQDDEANQSGWLLLSSLSSYFDPLWGHPQRMYAQRGGGGRVTLNADKGEGGFSIVWMPP